MFAWPMYVDGPPRYIRHFRAAVKASTAAEEVVEIMKAKCDRYESLTTLIVSAKAALLRPG